MEAPPLTSRWSPPILYPNCLAFGTVCMRTNFSRISNTNRTQRDLKTFQSSSQAFSLHTSSTEFHPPLSQLRFYRRTLGILACGWMLRCWPQANRSSAEVTSGEAGNSKDLAETGPAQSLAPRVLPPRNHRQIFVLVWTVSPVTQVIRTKKSSRILIHMAQLNTM